MLVRCVHYQNTRISDDNYEYPTTNVDNANLTWTYSRFRESRKVQYCFSSKSRLKLSYSAFIIVYKERFVVWSAQFTTIPVHSDQFGSILFSSCSFCSPLVRSAEWTKSISCRISQFVSHKLLFGVPWISILRDGHSPWVNRQPNRLRSVQIAASTWWVLIAFESFDEIDTLCTFQFTLCTARAFGNFWNS